MNTVIFGVFTAALAIWSNLWLFYLSMFLSGFGGGAWDSGHSMWLVDLWSENPAPVFQLSQMMYGCGAIIGPLLTQPFIFGDLINKIDTMNSTSSAVLLHMSTPSNTLSDDVNYSVDRRSNLMVPFFIGGGLMMISK